MSSKFKINIVSAEHSIYEGEVKMAYVPGSQGELGIAPGHAPLLTSLKPGEVRVDDNLGEQSFFISGGILEVQPKAITILSDTAIRADDLDESRALEAKERAEHAMADKQDDRSYADAVADLQNAMAQIEAISRLKKKASGRR